MSHAARPIRILAPSLIIALAACSCSSGNGTNDGGPGGDATPGDLCTEFTINQVTPTVTSGNGGTIDPNTFTGGDLVSGTYWLTSVTYYGLVPTANGSSETWIIDAAAKTLRIGTFLQGAPTYVGFTLVNTSPSVLSGTPACGSASNSIWSYTLTGGTLTVNLRGDTDVLVFTKQ